MNDAHSSTDHDPAQPGVDLFHRLLDAWNRRDARTFASLFFDEGLITGFDGSMMTGPAETESTLGQIFAHHQTGSYVGIVKSAARMTESVVTLRAVVGMIPPGAADINPALNAVQTLVAVDRDGWRIAAFQNTPAAFHGRPEAAQQLTEELRRLPRP